MRRRHVTRLSFLAEHRAVLAAYGFEAELDGTVAVEMRQGDQNSIGRARLPRGGQRFAAAEAASARRQTFAIEGRESELIAKHALDRFGQTAEFRQDRRDRVET